MLCFSIIITITISVTFNMFCLILFFTYRYKAVLQPLIDDLLKLESDQGIPVKTESGMWTLRAVLVHVLGDTLAIHEIFGLLSPSANMFCRACQITRNDLLSGEYVDKFTRRTEENVQDILFSSQIGQKTCTLYGIKSDCALHALKYFRWPASLTFDPMHDLLEGIIPMVLKKILQAAVLQYKTLTEDKINELIENFDYGDTEIRDKPSANFSKLNLRSKTNALCQSAAQTWLLLRAYPFIFYKFLDCYPKYKNMIATLLQITFISFSNKLTDNMINDLRKSVALFQIHFKTCFPNSNAINKMHHVVHYAQLCTENGPIANFSCMMYEGKFKESKSQSKTCGNFKNLSLSLTKRLNLKQINSITKHKYNVDYPETVSSSIVRKKGIDTVALLFDLPDEILLLHHLKVNGVNFMPGVIVKYEQCSQKRYGILLTIIEHESDIIFVIQELDVINFDSVLFAYKVTISQRVIRIVYEKLLFRKVYSLWQFEEEPCDYLYISLKYNDD